MYNNAHVSKLSLADIFTVAGVSAGRSQAVTVLPQNNGIKYRWLVIPATLKTEFTASLLDAQHHKDSWKEKVTSSFVVSFDKTLNDIPPCHCGRQVVGLSYLPFIMSQFHNKVANKSRAREQKRAN